MFVVAVLSGAKATLKERTVVCLEIVCGRQHLDAVPASFPRSFEVRQKKFLFTLSCR
jgi:hypothetical protein